MSLIANHILGLSSRVYPGIRWFNKLERRVCGTAGSRHKAGMAVRWMVVLCGFAVNVSLSHAAAPIKRDEPIQVNSDKLDVYQNEHKAIFTGNVIATQGTTTLRSVEMTVFYRDSEKPADEGNAAAPPSAPPEAKTAETPDGIYRIEAKDNVVFTTPTETALGDLAIYNVDTDTIDVLGKDVTLTRGQNVLKGTRLNYNMGTGRSVLTGGAADKPSRVRGLFVPKSDKPAAASKP